jgi:glycosyltransferase involved in cell wall biosynthesis
MLIFKKFYAMNCECNRDIAPKLVITPFPVDMVDGGGCVTRDIIKNLNPNYFAIRGEGWLTKFFFSLFGFLLFPYLHPIFTRYIPLSLLIDNNNHNILNFSQTFGGLLFSAHSTVICHDLQCHNHFIFKRWARWSEAFLFRRAKRIAVVSYRDAKILHRLYGIDPNKIFLIDFFLKGNIEKIHKIVQPNIEKLLFLGNMTRLQNQDAVKWFSKEVMPHFPKLYLDVIGEFPINYEGYHRNIRWLGKVQDLNWAFSHYELMIAPMFSRAGVKVKVFEALQFGLPVLGTLNAFSGLPRPEQTFCTNSPEEWCKTIRNGGVFRYKTSRL